MRKWIDWAKENGSVPDSVVNFIEAFTQDAAKDEEEWESMLAIRMKWLKYAQYYTAISLIFLFLTIFFYAIICG